MAAQLKETPTLSASESKRLVKTVAKTTLSPERKQVLEKYAQLARAAYGKSIK